MRCSRTGCLNKSQPDEPVFVLCARDAAAPDTVMRWAAQAEIIGAPDAKVQAALDVARAMRQWQDRNFRKVPD